MSSNITLNSPSGMSMEVDYAEQKIKFPRASGTEKILGMLPMEIKFSDITDVELRNPKLMIAGGCNIIINNVRYMTADQKNAMTFFATNDFKALKAALEKVVEACGLAGFKDFNSVNAVKEIYTQDMINFSSEKIKKCNVCGHVFCYSAEDVEKNKALATQAKISRFSQFSNAFNGANAASAMNAANANSYENQIRDFDICPSCNSRDLVEITKAEYEAEMKAKNASASAPAAAVSPMDELKKLKDLLDMQIITQEEFDAKKKQLLGL